jgi:hypothetical protein
VLRRYGRMIAAKREKERWKQAWRKELVRPSSPELCHTLITFTQKWQKKMRNRAILTGTIVRASYSNKPFPRMRPQPVHISIIIKKRRFARARRIEKYKLLTEWRRDMAIEKEFETALAAQSEKEGVQLPSVFRDSIWGALCDYVLRVRFC